MFHDLPLPGLYCRTTPKIFFRVRLASESEEHSRRPIEPENKPYPRWKFATALRLLVRLDSWVLEQRHRFCRTD